jgi:hypothetical protein
MELTKTELIYFLTIVDLLSGIQTEHITVISIKTSLTDIFRKVIKIDLIKTELILISTLMDLKTGLQTTLMNGINLNRTTVAILIRYLIVQAISIA